MRGCTDRAALGTSDTLTASGTADAAAGLSSSNLLAAVGVTAPLATPAQLAHAAAAAGGGAGAGAEPEAPPNKQQQQMWGIMGFGGLFVDNYQLPPDAAADAGTSDQPEHDPLAEGRLAWSSPLQHDWALSTGPRQVELPAVGADHAGGVGGSSSGSTTWGASGAAAGLVAAATAVAAVAQPPPASALSLAMRLVEGSQAAGITGDCGWLVGCHG